MLASNNTSRLAQQAFAVAALSLLLLPGCLFDASEERELIRDQILESREQWRSQGIDSYRILYNFQSEGVVRTQIGVDVRDGEVDAVRLGGQPAPDLIDDPVALTVEEIFDFALAAAEDDDERIRQAGFDRARGFPVILFIDSDQFSRTDDLIVELLPFESSQGETLRLEVLPEEEGGA